MYTYKYRKHRPLFMLVLFSAGVMAVTLAFLSGNVAAASSTNGQQSLPPPLPTAPTAVATPTSTPVGIPSPVPTSPVCGASFSDVLESDWFYEDVMWMVCNGIVGGYPDGTYRPNNNTTRGQSAKIIVLASRWPLYSPPIPSFSDVPADSVFYPYVETAVSHGILGGYDDGTFRPGNNVTRGQYCKLVVLARGWPLESPPTASFIDVPIGSTFFPYVETAVRRGVLGGYPDGTFRPDNSTTRAQMAKMTHNAFTTP